MQPMLPTVDDGAAASPIFKLPLHHRQDVLAAEEGGLEIEIYLFVPILLGHRHRVSRGRCRRRC